MNAIAAIFAYIFNAWQHVKYTVLSPDHNAHNTMMTPVRVSQDTAAQKRFDKINYQQGSQ